MFGNNCMTTITIHRVTQHRRDAPRTRVHASTTWAIKIGKERNGGEKIDTDTPLLTYYHCLRPPVDGDIQQSTAHGTWGETMENKAMRGDMKHFGDHLHDYYHYPPCHTAAQAATAHAHVHTRAHAHSTWGDDGKKNGK